MDETRQERRKTRFSDEELDALAERVRERIMDDLYGEVGKAVFKRAIQMLVVGGIAALAWFTGKELK